MSLQDNDKEREKKEGNEAERQKYAAVGRSVSYPRDENEMGTSSSLEHFGLLCI